LTSSGMAAITTVLFTFLRPGDHIVVPASVYSGTHELLANLLQHYHVEVTFINNTEISSFVSAIKKNTKILYTETPCNPSLHVTDLEHFGKIGNQYNVITVVDGTFGSPWNQQPLKLGINISIHSATKYLGGHSDILAGVFTVRRNEDAVKLRDQWRILGGILSPMDAFLLERGIKTLGVRMKVHNENAQVIAEFLEKHPKVEKVLYPGLPSHPHHNIAKKFMSGFGGMIAFELRGGVEAGKKFVETVRLITLAVSLGGVESLVEHSASMTHANVPRDVRLAGGITDGLIRLSVGIEDVRDLLEDIQQALDQIG